MPEVDWNEVWEEPSDDLWCKPISIDIVWREWEPRDDKDPGEGEYLTVEVKDLVNTDRERNPELSFRFPGKHRSSKLSVWKKEMASKGHPIKRNSDILNFCFHFRMKDLARGNIIYSNYPELAAVYLSEEDCVKAAAAAMGEKVEVRETETTALSASKSALIQCLDGKSWPEAVASVFADPTIQADAGLITILVDEKKKNQLFARLAEDGYVTEEDGMYHVA